MLSTRLPLFPLTTKATETVHGHGLTIANFDLNSLAEEYGTPLYVYDQATMDAAATSYREALAHHYPAETGVTFAGKALLLTAAAQWVQRQGFLLDCTGAGELHIAANADLASHQILVHGVNKSDEDLRAAVAYGGVIVVDNPTELGRLAHLAAQGHTLPELWLRVRPGVAVDTHAYRQTGQHDSKFGFSIDEAIAAVDMAEAQDLPVTGFHFHQGSQFFDPTPIGPGIDTVLDLVQTLHQRHSWLPKTISPGGGWGVAYHEDELPQPSVDAYIAFIAKRMIDGCQQRGLPLPRLQVEPGRSLVARAGVALYRVGAVKQTPSRRWLLIDGGMADNPRFALYGARYSCVSVTGVGREPSAKVSIAGPFCESGDVVIEDLLMPDLQEGELIAIPVAGAYHLSMSSNYNGARRPSTLMVEEGKVQVMLRRETVEDLTKRDIHYKEQETQ